MDIELTMQEETNNATTKRTKFQLGARLKAAREATNLSEKDAASRLHLSPKFITMMEEDNFDKSFPSTFIRGYLRSYARLLNITENEIAAALEQMDTNTAPAAITPAPQVLFSNHSNQNERYIRWITYVIAAILITLVGVWWSSHSRYAVSDVPPQESDAQPQPTAIAAPAPVETAAPTAATVVTKPEPIPAVAAPTAVQPIAQPSLPPAPIAPTITAPVQNMAPTTEPALAAPQPPMPTPMAPTPMQPPVVLGIPNAAPTPAPEEHKKARRHRDLSRMQMELPEPGLEENNNDYAN